MLYQGLSARGLIGVLKAHGWTQSAIGEAAGLSQPTIHALLTGRSSPTPETFKKLVALSERQAKEDEAFCRRLLSYLGVRND